MAAFISVPRDLSKVKTKVFMNLTKRQLLCFGAGALIGVPLFFVLKSTGNISFEEYKKAVKLYRGPVYREASHEHWLLATAEHYAIEYLFAVNQLLKDLAELKDYQSVQHFASKALEIEPGNAEAVYWLIAALMKIGSVQSAQAEYDRAKQMLPEPAFKELQEKLLAEQIQLK